MLIKQVPRSGLVAPGRYSAFLRSSVDFPRSQSSCPVKASRLQFTHSSERAAGAQASSTPTAINQTVRCGENIWFQQSLLGGHQLKPEQCSECSGSQGQSEPLVFEGANHIASTAAPINRAFSQKPTSTIPLSLSNLFLLATKPPSRYQCRLNPAESLSHPKYVPLWRAPGGTRTHVSGNCWIRLS